MATLRALECLVALADGGSVTRAARLLHSSQPAVSHQLAVLEQETRTPLVHREARGVRLTAAGRAALADARRAVDAAASAVRSARLAGAASGGLLRLACAQSLTVPLLAPVVGRWREHHPGVATTLRESVSLEELLGLVEAGDVDVAVVPAPVPDRFHRMPVADEEIVLTAPRGHATTRRASVCLGDLEGEPLVGFAPENGLAGWLDDALLAAGVRVEPAMRTAVTTAAPQLAAAGLGVAVTPVSAVAAGFPGEVRSFAPRWSRRLVAVTRAAPDPLVARFVDDLRARGVDVPDDVRRRLDDATTRSP